MLQGIRSHAAGVVGGLFAAGLILSSAPALSGVITVDESSTDWVFGDSTGGSCTTGTSGGMFEAGPGAPPAGSGSANLHMTGCRGMVIFDISGFGEGIKLKDITTLSFNTFTKSGSTPNAIALQFFFDKDLDDGDTSFQGSAVFEPRSSVVGPNPVLFDTWQTWDPLTAAQGWWLTGTLADNFCTISTTCSLSALLGQTGFGESGLRVNPGFDLGFLFKAGSGWDPGFDGNVDNFRLALSGGEVTTFDFETSQDIPEPMSLALLGFGLMGVGLLRRRRKAA